MNNKDVEVQLRSGTLDADDSHKLRGEEELVQSTQHRLERSRTPATVAEPDSTMSNEAGEHVMSADMDNHATMDHVTAESSGIETSTHDRVADEANDVMSSNCDVTDIGRRQFRDRFRLERILGFDAMRSGNASEIATKQTEDSRHVEPSSSELTRICQKKSESVLGRLSGLISRKRDRTDVEVDAEQYATIHQPPSSQTMDKQPPDTTRKKHRPDPLVLAPSSVEHYGYPSWLRSPRVWKGSSPIPYTPPPMLSPARRAPGLFWAAARTQNQPLWSLFRQPSAFTCELFCGVEVH